VGTKRRWEFFQKPVLNRNSIRRWNYQHNLCWARCTNFGELSHYKGGCPVWQRWGCIKGTSGVAHVNSPAAEWCILKSHQPCQGI
jgi:hypothetical protein